MKKYFENKITSAFIALFAMFLWGSAIPLIKTSYQIFHIPGDDIGAKILLAGYRFFGAGLIVLVYKWLFDREKIDYRKINIKLLFAISLVQISLQYGFYYIGLSNTDGVKAAIVQGLNPLIIVVLAHFVFVDDRITLKKAIALCIGLIGVLISNISNLSGLTGFQFTFSGEGFILCSTFFNALGTIMMRKYGQDQNSYIVSIFQFIFGSSILIIIGKFTSQTELVFHWKGILLLLYGSFISSTAFLLWYLLLKYQKAGNIGIFKLFIPIFGSILSILFLGESYNMTLFIALLLTSFATLFLNSNLMEKREDSSL
ncbi:MAG: DMT family transporter [Tissierellia bacterium]|nr:DMT family transporter [Tissierellia bacterium]